MRTAIVWKVLRGDWCDRRNWVRAAACSASVRVRKQAGIVLVRDEW